jgi:hypothetical protein
MSPEEIVQKQVEAYNSRDIETFVSCHHPSVELYQLGEDNPFLEGITALAARYKDIFDQSPNLHSEVTQRLALNNVVIDQEIVTGRVGTERTNFIAIYQIRDGLIAKVSFVTD